MRMRYLVPLLLVALGSTVLAQDEDIIFSVETEAEDWDLCGYDYTETCPPTISIEQAACAAPLIVYGRVLQSVNGETREDTAVEIQVEFRSLFFDEPRKTVQKWGAGLENTNEASVFFNNSGFFNTWITGFNNTPTDLAPAGFGTTPCGTRSPKPQEEVYFFLEALPENEGKTVEFGESNSLNVNFTLSTSILQTGHAPGNNDVFALINTGAFTDDNLLEGNCQAVYCCYNPDCGGDCDTLLASVADSFTCDNTEIPDGAVSRMGSFFLLAMSAIAIALTTFWN